MTPVCDSKNHDSERHRGLMIMRPRITAWLIGVLWMLTSLCPAQDPVLRVIAMPTPDETSPEGNPLGEQLGPEFVHQLSRFITRAEEDLASIIVFEITTPGGDELSIKIIDDLVRDLRRRNIRTVAFVPTAATSAGAMFALACDELILGPGAAIGNAVPIRSDTLQLAPEKKVAEFESMMAPYSQTGGYHPYLLRGMINQSMELYGFWKPDTGEFRVLTALEMVQDGSELKAQGFRQQQIKAPGGGLKLVQGGGVMNLSGFESVFPHRVANGREDLRRVLGLSPGPLKSDELLAMPPSKGFGYLKDLLSQIDWRWLLLVGAFTCFVLEFKTPGLGAFGVTGLLFLIGFFAVQEGEGLPIAFTLALLLLGFFLLLAEFFLIPGFGVAGISGIVLIVFAIYAATIGLDGQTWQERVIPDSDRDWVQARAWLTLFLGALVVGVSGSLFAAKGLPHVPFLRQMFPAPPSHEAVSSSRSMGASPFGWAKVSVGMQGIAETDLRPSGHASFSGVSLDVVSDGGWIRKGRPVEVVLVEGHRVVVTGLGEGEPTP